MNRPKLRNLTLKLLHGRELVIRSYYWGPREFVAYIFGYLVILFAVSFSGRSNREIMTLCALNMTMTIIISTYVDFMSPYLFLFFVLTLIIFLMGFGLYTNYLLIALEQEQEENLKQSKMVAIGEIAATLSHEINNTLMVVVGLLRP